MALLSPLDRRRLQRGLRDFESVVVELESVMARVQDLSALGPRHLYLGLPIGRDELQQLLVALPTLVSVDLLLSSDEAVEALAAAPQLESVRIRRTRESVGIVGGMPALAALRSLEIAYWGPLAPGLLERVPQLERLHLDHTTLAAEDVRVLPTMLALRHLGLGTAGVDAPMLREVAACPGLEILDIADNSLKPQETALVAKRSQLKELDLSRNRVDLAPLSDLPLRRLTLERAELTFEDVPHLVGFSNLDSLNIDDNNLGHDSGPILAELLNLRALHANGNRLEHGARHLGSLQ